MNWKVIIRNIGFALLVNALFMLFSIFVSMANGNDSALAALMISFTITFIVGIFPFIQATNPNLYDSVNLGLGYSSLVLLIVGILLFLIGFALRLIKGRK